MLGGLNGPWYVIPTTSKAERCQQQNFDNVVMETSY